MVNHGGSTCLFQPQFVGSGSTSLAVPARIFLKISVTSRAALTKSSLGMSSTRELGMNGKTLFCVFQKDFTELRRPNRLRPSP